jgi:hypothetical protein
MKRTIERFPILALGFAGLILALAGCDKEGPRAVWDPNSPLGTKPVILSVDPASRAVPGVQTIALHGSHFSADPSKNIVYFFNKRALIKSCSDTEIVVYRPDVSGDSIKIQVEVEGVVEFGAVPGYGVDEAVRYYGRFTGKNLSAILAVDAQENLYSLKTTNDVIKIDAAETQVTIGSKSFRAKASDMRVGPDGRIYIQALKNRQLYRIPDGGGDTEKYAQFPGLTSFFDFDRNGNIYGAGDKTGIGVILPDLTTKTSGGAEDLTVTWLRTYEDALYLTDGAAIYRLPILGADGTLGAKTKVLELSAFPEYAASKIVSFALASDGTWYVAVDHDDAVIIVHTDGSVEPLYKGILIANSGQLLWANSKYLYLNMTGDVRTNDILRIDPGKTGAAYWGTVR